MKKITDKAISFLIEKLSEYRSESGRVLDGGNITEYNFCPTDDYESRKKIFPN